MGFECLETSLGIMEGLGPVYEFAYLIIVHLLPWNVNSLGPQTLSCSLLYH